MNEKQALAVRVVDIKTISPCVKQFTLADAHGAALPAFSSGSHICVTFGDGQRAWRNAYSLIGDPGGLECYQIAVRKGNKEHSRGGSIYLHEAINTGDQLQISPPANFFPLARHARKHILIAGGIGITPILSHLAYLRRVNASYELHYAFRDDAFVDAFRQREDNHIHLYDATAGQRLDLTQALDRQPLGTHVYVCGPHSLITATRTAAAELGWPLDHIHSEEFAPLPSEDSQPFTVVIPSYGLTVNVAAEQSLLSALEDAGVLIASSCRAGRCGTCRIHVVEGSAEHRDQFLTEEERGMGLMLACVSRACGESLTVELLTP